MDKLVQTHHPRAELKESQKNQLKQKWHEAGKNSATLEEARHQIALLESQLNETIRCKDEATVTLQHSLDNFAKQRGEFEIMEGMLRSKVQTLDTALDATKNEIARDFVDDFSATLEQFRALYLDLDQSDFDPFKIVGNENS